MKDDRKETKAERKKKFVAECFGPYPSFIMGAGVWFEVVDALEVHATKCLGDSAAVKKLAEKIRQGCFEGRRK